MDPAEPALGHHYNWWPLVDSDAYMARGHEGQALYIDPASDTVVVKLSYFPRGNAVQLAAFPETMAFLRAVSRWKAR